MKSAIKTLSTLATTDLCFSAAAMSRAVAPGTAFSRT